MWYKNLEWLQELGYFHQTMNYSYYFLLILWKFVNIVEFQKLNYYFIRILEQLDSIIICQIDKQNSKYPSCLLSKKIPQNQQKSIMIWCKFQISIKMLSLKQKNPKC